MCSWRKGGWAGWARQGNRENDHPDACQRKRAVEIRRSILSVWKKRPSGCLGNCDELQHEGRKSRTGPVALNAPTQVAINVEAGGGEELTLSFSTAGTDPA